MHNLIYTHADHKSTARVELNYCYIRYSHEQSHPLSIGPHCGITVPAPRQDSCCMPLDALMFVFTCTGLFYTWRSGGVSCVI